ncbi:MAG: hypothetical protein M0Z92_06565 [Actinomycetota bacterium]|jgi:hypothetical protein|nr:hypothetical protein [Actinomycetota bacterium]
MANRDSDAASDIELDQALEVIINQARIRLDLPQLMVKVLDRNPQRVFEAIRALADHTRPITDIAEDLRRTLEEG